ncbi:phage tail family protein [Streptomyces phaeochromogenes]|uniref:phage distal tail protein n=1 Tax=Streptomyces phaeochromogenes TaxID=1923 RepID=UPI002256294D|nr:phage tail domain-containing protein [Streptomyces phaeochromogenes]MCX5601631.1 phage tail family protein [Streptomyces phaeochromogenes]
MPYTAGDSLGGRRVDLGTIPLGGVDTSGVAWVLQKFEGWDAPESEGEVQRREGDHGAWASPVYLRERPMTLGGVILAQDLVALDDAMDRLAEAVSLTDTTLTVWQTPPRQAIVRRSGRPVMEHVTDRVATYSIMVTAPDPRRYSAELEQESTHLPSTTGGLVLPAILPMTLTSTTAAGQINAYNAGKFETRPVLVLDGPVTAPQVLAQMPDGSVKFLNYSQSLASGEQLVIDTDAHSVILNGSVSRRRFLSTPTGWPTIPAGSTVSFQFRSSAYNASALLTARWRSAWI